VNWSVYNDSLVRRGEILLDFGVLEGWDLEVKRINTGRRGRPLTYPKFLIKLLASIGLLHLPYTQIEGFTRGLSKYVEGSAAPDSTTLNRRLTYGLRWIAESAFSWMKRVFGKYVTTKKRESMIREITLNVFLYNPF